MLKKMEIGGRWSVQETKSSFILTDMVNTVALVPANRNVKMEKMKRARKTRFQLVVKQMGMSFTRLSRDKNMTSYKFI